MRSMKKLFMLMVGLLAIINCSACASDNIESELDNSSEGSNVDGSELFDGKKVLIAYFSRGGTTRRILRVIRMVMAQVEAQMCGATILMHFYLAS